MSKAENLTEQSKWHELTPGCEIYEPGTAQLTNTGDWRTQTPVWLTDKCRQCLLCVPYCPDSSIPVVDLKRTDFDFMHCKGCGICAKVCPFEAIAFQKEGQ